MESRNLLAATGYVQQDLVSNQPLAALIQDPNLINPWGVAVPASNGKFWVSDNGTGVSTVYGGGVSGSAFVKDPLVAGVPGGFPTGDVVNTTSDFNITAADGSVAPALFLFSTQTGDIVGMSPSELAASPTKSGVVAASVSGADFTGLTIGQDSSGNNLLFAADFQNGTIDEFDGTFKAVSLASGAFTDPNLPSGFAPFNIQDIGGKLYVTYAQQTPGGEDGGSGSNLSFVPGKTGGIIDVYDTSGTLLNRFATGSSTTPLNAPWGMVLAPSGFGQFGGDILVANFGDGSIDAFKTDGTFDGQLSGTNGNPLVIDGVRGLSFGNGATAGDANTLFFTSEPSGVNAAPEKTSVLLLDPSSQGALSAVGDGTVNVAGGGEVVVDSNNSAAVVGIGDAQMAAPEFDITGVPGVSLTGDAQIIGKIDSGVTAMADPLASLAAPTVPTQTFSGMHVSGQRSVTLQPGTYTGTIVVTGQARVTLMPGLYYLEGGISVTGNGRIQGQGVTLYLASSGAGVSGDSEDEGDDQGDDEDEARGVISLHGNGSIQISAPTGTTNPLAGVAIFEARDNSSPIVIGGNGSLKVIGTIYAPAATVNLSGNGFLGVHDDVANGITAELIASDLHVSGDGDFDMLSAGVSSVSGENGLMGSLQTAGSTAIVATSTDVTFTEGQQMAVAVASFSATSPTAAASDFTATVDWGDGSTTSGTVTSTGNGGFLVTGSHSYVEEGTETISVTISDTSGDTATATDVATVVDAKLIASGVVIGQISDQGDNNQGNDNSQISDDAKGHGHGNGNGNGHGHGDGHGHGNGGGGNHGGNQIVSLSVNDQVVATFVDTGGAEPVANYTATIDWGDGTAPSTGTVSLSSDGTFFNVTGSHTYSVGGRYDVTVTIKDEGGAQTTAQSLVLNGNVGEDEDDIFVNQSFEDLLGRPADEEGLTFFVNALQNGQLTPSALAGIITESAEFLDDVISQAYKSFLGRNADSGGLQFWLSQMQHGMTNEQLDAAFIGSPEFFTHSGGTDQSWVNEMYFDLLGRAPDAGGMNYWLTALAHGANHGSVAVGFAASPEHERMTVQSDYQTFLGRGASSSEVNYWVNRFEHGTSNEQVVAGFIGSNEYFQQQTSNGG